jgi:phosphohistidine swiveling domain-containing protein
MNTAKKLLAAGAVAVLVCSCSKLPEDFLFDNPRDTSGTNWRPPVVTAMNDCSLDVNDSLTITATATDNGSIVRYLWSRNGTTYVDSTTADSFRVAWPGIGRKVVRVKVRDNDRLLSLPDSCVVQVTQSIPVVTAMKDSSIDINDSLTVTASATDNGSIVRYLWSRNGTTYADSTTTGSFNVAWSSGGWKVVRVMARDNDGLLSLPDSCGVMVTQSVPVVTAMKDSSVDINDSLTVTATATDNGSISRYIWSRNGTTYVDTTVVCSLKVAWASIGRKVVRVMAIDNDSLLSLPDSCVVLVTQTLPVVTAMNDTFVYINDSLTVTAAGTDNGSIVRYLWSRNGTTYVDSTTTGSFNVAWKLTDTGRKVVRVRVRDNDGLLSTPDSCVVQVRAGIPVVTAMNDISIYIKDSLSVTAVVTDNGNILKYIWARNGTAYADTTTVDSLKVAWPDTGRHVVRVKVMDDDSLISAPDSCIVQVRRGFPKVTAMDDTTAIVKDSLTITAAGADTNGSILKYLWARDGANYTDTLTTGSLTVVWVLPADTGRHVVRVKVMDDDSLVSMPDSCVVLVSLGRPVVTAMQDTVGYINDSITITAAGVDNGNITHYIWASDGATYSDTTTSGSFNIAWPDTGRKAVRVKVMDDDSLVSMPDSCVVWVSLGIPVATAMKDTTITRNDSVTVTAVATDNGTIVKYVWAVNGTTYADTTAVGAIRVSYPDTGRHVVRIIVIDDDSLVSAPDSCVLRVTLPNPPKVTPMADTSVAVNDSFYVYAAGTDSGGTIMKYLWALDGVSFKDSTDSGRIGIAFASAGVDTVKVKVRDNDAIESDVASLIITVHLYAPRVTAMADTTVAVNDSFDIHAVGTDTNGIVVKYLWALDGANFSDSTDSGRVRTAFAGTGIKTVLVKVRDDDGIASAVDSVIVIVKDSMPINISPSDSTAITDSLPTFRWIPGFYTDSFRVLLDTISVPAAVAATGVTDSSFSLTTPLTSGRTYYWQVIGLNAIGQEARGKVWRFRYDSVLTLVPYMSDVNTVLLDHLDGSTSASINGVINGANCVALSAATPSYAYGIGQSGLGQAITLGPPAGQPAGSASYLRYSIMDILSQASGTIEFRVYTTAYGISIADQGQYYNACMGWTFRMGIDSTGHLTSSDWDGYGDWNVASSQIVPLNTWTHVAVTWGSAGVKMYINGAQVGSHSSTHCPAGGYSGYLMMLCGSYKGAVCTIDELRVSNIQRTTFNLP